MPTVADYEAWKEKSQQARVGAAQTVLDSVEKNPDWTDRHCRFFHRLLTQKTLLYTEMLTAEAIIHGPRARLLAFDPSEHPVALQLGGSDPKKLVQALRVLALKILPRDYRAVIEPSPKQVSHVSPMFRPVPRQNGHIFQSCSPSRPPITPLHFLPSTHVLQASLIA